MQKKFFPTLLTSIFLTLAFCSCCNRADSDSVASAIYQPRYAHGFCILGEDGKESSLIRVTSPWQGDSTAMRELLICRNDEPVPDGYSGPILHGDAERIVCLSSTHIAMLHMVAATDNIVGVSGIDNITSQDILSRRAEIEDIGAPGEVDFDQIKALKPDLVILYGVDGANPLEAELKKGGIPYLYVGEYTENTPLGKAEWMVAVAEAVGKRSLAEEVFNLIPEKYDALKKRVQNAGTLSHPKVMMNMPYEGKWIMPGADSDFVTLINDAGGEYVGASLKGSNPHQIDDATAMRWVEEADRWINLGPGINTIGDITRELPKFVSMSVLWRGGLYNNTERMTPAGGNDFYESGVVNPDLVLRDLMKIMHPELVPEPFIYYRPVTSQQPSDSEEEEAESLSDLSDLEGLSEI